ncbi:hypothetical protein LBMAG42_52790 [Deltaproteobacteria bacterium]|nr:hypothetical protein LBMAG42_52790 [Deltaproteobacteria bacterium]
MQLPHPRALALVLTALLAACAPPADPDPTRIDTIILVSLDTTRADRIGGAFGNTRGLTPNLDAFAAGAVSFTNAWAVANLTSMSHGAVFTSRYPSEVGRPGGDFHLDGRAPTLAGILGVYGWQTAAFTSGGHLSRQFGLDRDFGWFQHTPFQGSMWHTVPAALTWQDSTRKPGPAFLFVHGYDAHTPYMAPAPFGRAYTDRAYAGTAGPDALATRLGSELIFGPHLFHAEGMLGFLVKRNRPRIWDAAARAAVEEEAAAVAKRRPGEVVSFTDADVAYVREVYDGAIAYQDAMFGELVEGLERRGVLAHAAIVVFGDHGESLGEHGRFGHGEWLGSEELHVPLLVRIPGGSGRAVAAPVSLLDVLPTVIELADATLPAQARGQSLLPWLQGATGPEHPTRFAEGNLGQQTVLDAAGQLLVEGIRPESTWYSDIIGNADLAGPAFRGEGAAADVSSRAAYRTALLAWHDTMDRPSFAEPASKEAVEEMKKNGYFTP